VALKPASEKLKNAMLLHLQARRRTVNEEMGFMGAIKAKGNEAANRHIEVVRRLESEGDEIDGAKTGGPAMNRPQARTPGRKWQVEIGQVSGPCPLFPFPTFLLSHLPTFAPLPRRAMSLTPLPSS
jgi:hypothetical protein